jgi:phosphate/sulfate permease
MWILDNWKLIVLPLLGLWIIASIIYFIIKFNILKKRKKLKLKEDVVIIYNDKLEEPPI